MRIDKALGGAAFAAVVWVSPAVAVAQQADQPLSEEPATPSSDPQRDRLAAAVDAIAEGDPSKDPEGDLVKLAEIERGFDAHGAMPPVDRGLLESAIGGAHFYLKQYDEAVGHYQAAASLFVEGDAPPGEIAGLYNNIATLLASMAQYDEAMGYHEKALAMRRSIEGERGPMVSSSLFGIGYVLFRQGRIEESLPYFRDSVEQQLEFLGPEHYNTIVRMTSLASVLGRAGREREALEVARRAEALAREHLGLEHPTYAITLNNLGNSLIENGLNAQAIPVLRQTLQVRIETVGKDASGTALSLRNLSTALKQTGALEEAEELQHRAVAIFEASGETDTPEALGYMYADLADYAARRGDEAAYAELAARSIAEADAALGEDDNNRAQIHLYHADHLRERGDVEQALAIAKRWVPVMQASLIEDHKDRIAAEALLALLLQEAGESQVSLSLAKETTAKLKAKLVDLTLSEGRLVREAESNRLAALRLLARALAADDKEGAFAALQLANISDLSLSQQAAFSGRAETANDAAGLRRHLLDLARKEAELRTRQSASFDAGDPAKTAALGAELDEAIAARDAADAELRARFPEYVARLRPEPVSLATLLESLDANDVIVSPVEGDGQGWAITIDRVHGLVARELDSRAVRRLVAKLRGALADTAGEGDFPYTEAARLGAMVLPESLPSGSDILVYGGRSLASLPLAVLLTHEYSGRLANAPWLVRDASVRVVGNLDLFARENAAESSSLRASDISTFAGIGGAALPGEAERTGQVASLFRSGSPAYQSIADLPALANAEIELRAIADAFPGDDDLILVGPLASEEKFKQTDLSQASVIAFATHGLVSGEMRDLWEPALLLGTDDGSEEDGLLGASEIAQLELNADWVILSACNTAAGANGGAPVYSGLATAFAQAGARSLMLSHWRVRDDAAAVLSVETVRRTVQGLSRAEALRAAQLALMARSDIANAAHPAIWAPFVILEN